MNSDPKRSRLPPDLRELASMRLMECPADERSEACAELVRRFPEYEAELFRLLQKIRGTERLLDRSFPAPELEGATQWIAGHRVLRHLGRGAFGTVFLCAQEHPVKRHVAIKVLRRDLDEHQVLRRFHAERQVLASLSHPTIAQIHDAGSLPDGRPYIVMEFVDGLPITQYVRSRELNMQACLQLFIELCHGVDHAHGRGIVHRDLKPGNVLVVETSGKPQPKIIDFGIAKAVQEAGAVAEVMPTTETGRIMGTPGYMSPEQARGEVAKIDQRTDVFALGVMLYELLTDELPWPRGVWQATTTDPARPSVRITHSARRKTGPESTAARKLAARVRGDLDWITLKAVQREREARYSSASDLADDLTRHLAGRVVLAGPPSLAYRLRKLLRRQRIAALALFLSACLGIFLFTIANWQTRSARELANSRDRDALAAVERLLRRANDPSILDAPRSEPTRHALATDALAFYEDWLRERPSDPALREGRSRALATLSEVHALLGQSQAANETAVEVTRESQALIGGDPERLDLRALHAESLLLQVKALHLERDYEKALPLCEQAVSEFESCSVLSPARHGISFARALRQLGVMHQVLGDAASSNAACERSIVVLEDLIERGFAIDAAKQDLIWARFTLAGQRMKDRDFESAEALLDAAEAALPDVASDRLRTSAVILCQQGQVSMERGDLDAAVSRMTRALAACDAWTSEQPKQVRALLVQFQCARLLARVCEQRGDFEPALAAKMRTLEIAARKAEAFPEDPSRVYEERITLYEFARSMWNRFRRRDLTRALEWMRRCEELIPASASAGGPQRPLAWETQSVYARIAESNGEVLDATWDRLSTELPRSRELSAEEPAQQVVEAWVGITRSRFRRGNVDGAEAALRETEPYLHDPQRVDTKLRADLAFWRAHVALAKGDRELQSRAVAELLTLRPTWWGHWQAGDCEFAAWRKSSPDTPERLARRDAAAAHFEVVVTALRAQVEATPDDPWPVLPWVLCSIGLALVESERGEATSARTRVDAALLAFQRIEAEAHRDLLDAQRLAEGRELAKRLSASPPR